MGSPERQRGLQAPARAPGDQQAELVADLARCWGYVRHTHELAERAGGDRRLALELQMVGDQLSCLHQVALVAGGWCPECGTELTDPSLSPSRARHCRRCRLGWTLVDGEDRIRARSRPWPPRLPGAGTTPQQRPAPAAGDHSGRRSA